ncbi:FAD-binding and (Fe-S)-binding domain-containing protein [Pseudonocardia sp. WMMC193]|uniref:FAD-binding and (Fe-S)-binding domain-containing protein n=1 Tax=Pseudonocardia sp. WMMC193 TaxID=2911965 RepID=UPI001F4522C7|nr:FAD-binding and (Fe-S)-binding domain-containing protein [Pseudonocardia sp. WMMC193]MCF7552963.1 FAD-binding oxidoreductase [Pseudonocardia sp. WMMC193]
MTALEPTTTTDAAAALAADLQRVVGGEVRFDPAHRAMWSADASNYRKVPIGVVRPRDAADVEAALAVCREHQVPVLPRGAGTSIAGQAVNTAVVLDFTRHMNRILEIDPEARTARVEPGVICDQLRDAAAPHGLTFGPDPSTHNRCTIGGMIGNNACGSHSVAWGKTVDNTVRLEALTYRGERIDTRDAMPAALLALHERIGPRIAETFPDLTRRVSGYNLDQLPHDLAKAMVGSEGTLAVTTAATMRLVESPPARALAVLGFESAYVAADNVMVVREHAPLTIEGMDSGLIAALRAQDPVSTSWRALPPGGGWLYVETGGADKAEARAKAQAIAAAMKPYGLTEAVVEDDAARMKALWRIREDGAGILTRSPDGGEAWPGWEDAAVPPERFGSYLREFDRVLERHGRKGVYYGHFGDGCLHVRIDFDLLTGPGVANFRAFMEDAADAVVAHGGSLSGEHGDGRARSELLPRMYPPDVIAAFEEFKGIFDPDDRMNPGCIVRSARLDEDLRIFMGMPALGTPALGFTHDRGEFGRALRRCLGVGKCVTSHGGVMCPSYRATGDEQHSTRGRARLLFEMANGEVVTGGFQDDDVADALDLCLSCKGCKTDCPVGVDMAAYKTEFLAQRYRNKLRPASHYSMGALPRWMRLVGKLPASAVTGLNALARVKPLAALAKRVGGIAPEREIPAIAPETFTTTARARALETAVRPAPRGRLLLWPDTFTDHFDPSIAEDAVAVLESLGYGVELPPRTVCCGLTWTSTGQVGAARRVLRRSLRTIAPWVEQGVPVVGLEPSCTAALRTDAEELLPDEPLVAALDVRTFAELLAEHTDELRERASGGARALVQLHCHQYADLGSEADRAVMAALGIEAEVLDSGCCGLAGNFGFEKGHYEVSMAAAERVLLPAVRTADPDVAVIADGFSCRTQLRQAGTREPVHLARMAAQALGLRAELRPDG